MMDVDRIIFLGNQVKSLQDQIESLQNQLWVAQREFVESLGLHSPASRRIARGGKSMTKYALEKISSAPAETWSARALAVELSIDESQLHTLRTILCDLYRSGQIQRVGVGRYRALTSSPDQGGR